MKNELNHTKNKKNQAQPRKSPWDLLIGLLAWSLDFSLATLFNHWIQLYCIQALPPDTIWAWQAKPSGTLFALAVGFLPFSLWLANEIAHAIPFVHDFFDKEAKKTPGGSFKEAQAGLWPIVQWTLPFLLLVAFGCTSFNLSYIRPNGIYYRSSTSLNASFYSWADVYRINSWPEAREEVVVKTYQLQMKDGTLLAPWSQEYDGFEQAWPKFSHYLEKAHRLDCLFENCGRHKSD